MACVPEQSLHSTPDSHPQVSASPSIAKPSEVPQILNQDAELTCVIQLVQSGQIEGDLNIQARCLEILAPEQVTFSSEQARNLTRQAHNLLVAQQCQQSADLYEQAYQLEASLAGKGYLAQRITNAQQCQQGLVSIEQRRPQDTLRLESAAQDLSLESELVREWLNSGHEAIKIQACQLALALYQRAANQLVAEQNRAYLQEQRLNAQQCLSAQRLQKPSAWPDNRPLPWASAASQPETARPSVFPAPEVRFTPAPVPTAFVVPSQSLQPGAPAVPNQLQISDLQATQLTLSWQSVPGAQFYRIYRDGTLLINQITQTQETIFALNPRTTYYFEVAAVNPSGESARMGLFAITAGYLISDQSLVYSGSQGLSTVRLDGTQPALLFKPEIPFAVSPQATHVVHGNLKISDIFGQKTISVSHSLANPQDFSWSPDGRRIAFHATTAHNFSDLFVLNLDGSQLTQLSFFMEAQGRPAWSPDGQQLAFIAQPEGQAQLYLVSSIGSAPRKLLEQAVAGPLLWWLDGSGLLVRLTDQAQAGNYQVTLSGELNPLPELTGLIPETPSFSPNGQHLLFGADNGIYRLDLQNRQLQLLNQAPANKQNANPSWAGDGQSIYFDSNREGGYQIYRVDIQGEHLSKLTSPPGTARQPLWVY